MGNKWIQEVKGHNKKELGGKELQEESWPMGNNTAEKEENDTRYKKSTLERCFCLFIYSSLT